MESRCIRYIFMKWVQWILLLILQNSSDMPDNLQVRDVVNPVVNEGQGHDPLPAWPSSHSCSCEHQLLLTAYQLPLHITHVQGELVTPTGAAIAAAIRTGILCRSSLSSKEWVWAVVSEITGLQGFFVPCGSKYLRRIRIRRVWENGETREAPDDKERDQVMVLESNLDDCTGETLGFVMEELLQAGALDVWYQPIYMKKSRPAYKLSILCKIQDRKSMEKLVFVHTTAIGIRYYLVNRSKMIREIKNVSTYYGTTQVKFCTWEGQCYCYPESDSVAELARKNKKSFSELCRQIKLEAEKTM